jgi:hypothetical protein
VVDADPPSSRLAIEPIELPNVRERLFEYAKPRTDRRRTRTIWFEEMLLRVLDPDDAPWDPARGSFITCVGYLMRHYWDGNRPGLDRLWWRYLLGHVDPHSCVDENGRRTAAGAVRVAGCRRTLRNAEI